MNVIAAKIAIVINKAAYTGFIFYLFCDFLFHGQLRQERLCHLSNLFDYCISLLSTGLKKFSL